MTNKFMERKIDSDQVNHIWEKVYQNDMFGFWRDFR